MGTNFNTMGESLPSPKLNQVNEERLKQETSLRERHELISKLDINPEFQWELEKMLEEINASLNEIILCKKDILAANDEILAPQNSIVEMSSYRKRPVFEEIKKAA